MIAALGAASVAAAPTASFSTSFSAAIDTWQPTTTRPDLTAQPDLAAQPDPAAQPDSAAQPSSSPSDAPLDARTLAAFADCSIVPFEEVPSLLGYGVSPASTTARAEGVCSYGSALASEDGLLSYTVVTKERLARLEPYFTALARLCAGTVPSSPRAAACAMYVKLASVRDLDDYYAVRVMLADAEPVAGLGDAAASAGGALYVRDGGFIIEAVVRRDGVFDLERAEGLARLLLARVHA